MFAMTRPRMLIAVIVGVAFAALLALAAFSPAKAAEKTDATNEETVTTQNHNWSTYHWARMNNPFTLQLGDNVTSDWDSYLKTTAGIDAQGQKINDTYSDWSDAPVLDAKVAQGHVSAAQLKRKKCPPTTGMIEVCNTTFGNTGWSGLAQIWLDSTGHITAGTTKLNDTNISRTDTWKRNHVMCQEVGHDFGLGHTSENGTSQQTCMDYSGAQESQWPNQHDYDELSAMYDPGFTWPAGYTDDTQPLTGHLDTKTTIGASSASKLPAAAKRDKFNTKAEWGQLKAKDSLGKHEVYERDFGDGKLITFVEVEDQAAQPAQKK